MSIKSLRHDAETFHNENRNGYIIYSGDAMKYHEWEFKTKPRCAGESKNYIEQVSKVVDGLRGNSFVVAQEVGLAKLYEDD